MKLLLTAMLLICPLSVLAAVTPSSVRQSVDHSGAPATIQSLELNGGLQTVLKGITRGDSDWISLYPALVRDTSSDLAAEFIEAMGFALVTSPGKALSTLDEVDKYIAAKDEAMYRFGTQVVCIMPMTYSYDKPSSLRYYKAVTTSLATQGKHGAECLKIINESMDEINVGDQQGKTHWGTRHW
jgi:hypothetical protein